MRRASPPPSSNPPPPQSTALSLPPPHTLQDGDGGAVEKGGEGTGEEEEWMLVPPDGGRGWFILAGTLLINMLIPGTIKSFGVLFVEFIEVFRTSPFVASWIPALCYFLYCSTGPLTTYLSIKTSYRTVTIAGGVSAALGLILSCFATSITYLYVSFGVLVGLGAGLSFPPGIYLCASYFVKRRGLANGIAISGSAIGSIIFPPFIRVLLQTYGYRGAVLIMGGLTLNVIVGALMYDPVEKHMKRVRVTRNTADSKDGADTGALQANTASAPHSVQILHNPGSLLVSDEGSVEKPVVPPDSPPPLTSQPQPVIISRSHLLREDPESGQPLLSQSLGTRKISVPVSAYRTSRKLSTASFGSRLAMGSTGQIGRKVSHASPMMLGSTGQMGMSRNLSVASNMSSSSLRYVSTAFHGSTLVGLHPGFASNPDIQAQKPDWFSCCRSKAQKKQKKKEDAENKKPRLSWIELFKNPIYLIILFSNATNAIGYVNFTILVPAYAQSLGYDKDLSSYLLSIIACTDLIGRVGGATLSDIIKIDKRIYFIGGYLISGISLVFMPLCVFSYRILSVDCALFGLASGTYVGITAVIMADILGEDLLASSYGISLFVNGILQLIGPPICGTIYQQIGNYNPVMSGLGIVLVLGAAVWLLVPFIKKDNKS